MIIINNNNTTNNNYNDYDNAVFVSSSSTPQVFLDRFTLFDLELFMRINLVYEAENGEDVSVECKHFSLDLPSNRKKVICLLDSICGWK